MTAIITKHAKQRLKERSGVKGATAEQKAQMALEHGLTMEEIEGSLYKYLIHLYCTHGEIGHMRLYNYQIYCFDENVLITVYNLPKQYAHAFERARKKKAAPKITEALEPKDEKEKEPMNELTIINHEGTLVADSREVAEWVGKEHKNLIRDIENYCKHLDSEDGSILSSPTSSAFFIPSTYQSEQNKTLPCYLITKKGCDMVANKLTGEKGVKFSAAYINRFYEMENILKEAAPRVMSPAELALLQAQTMVDIERKQNEQQAALEGVTKRLDTIGSILALNPNGWRQECRDMLSKIAYSLGDIKHVRDLQQEVYQLLDDRFGVRLSVRLTNMKRVAAENGMCKSKREKLNYLDVIAEDKKLIEAYVMIVKEMAIKHGLDKTA